MTVTNTKKNRFSISTALMVLLSLAGAGWLFNQANHMTAFRSGLLVSPVKLFLELESYWVGCALVGTISHYLISTQLLKPKPITSILSFVLISILSFCSFVAIWAYSSTHAWGLVNAAYYDCVVNPNEQNCKKSNDNYEHLPPQSKTLVEATYTQWVTHPKPAGAPADAPPNQATPNSEPNAAHHD